MELGTCQEQRLKLLGSLHSRQRGNIFFDRVMYMIHPPSKAKKLKDAC